MSHHHHFESEILRSQEKKFRRIEWMRKAKRWLKKLLIVVVVILAIAAVLSYIFVTQEPAPDNLEVPEKGFHGIF